MTLAELRRSDAVTITATDIAEILGMTPHAIRMAARDCPERLGFPVIVYGSRVRIPRVPLLRFLGEEVAE